MNVIKAVVINIFSNNLSNYLQKININYFILFPTECEHMSSGSQNIQSDFCPQFKEGSSDFKGMPWLMVNDLIIEK